MSFARAERRRAERNRQENPRDTPRRDDKYGHPRGKWHRGSPRYGVSWFQPRLRFRKSVSR